MLKEGAFITGVGELKSGKYRDGLKLQPPSNGSPFYLTVLPLSSLIRKLDDEKRIYRFLAFLCGGIGLVIVGLITRKWWRERTRKLKEKTKKQQTSSQIERQQNVQENEQPEVQACVICCQNRRRIILLPCGHVCLCEDCSARITDFCPICRTEIETKSVAYIS
jgi:E3 ubiquitin-protein ligase MUL1